MINLKNSRVQYLKILTALYIVFLFIILIFKSLFLSLLLNLVCAAVLLMGLYNEIKINTNNKESKEILQGVNINAKNK